MPQIGDILAKMGRNEALTTTEQQQIRLWGNMQEHNSAFVTGLQNGQSVIYAQEVNAIKGEFEYPPSGAGLRLGKGSVSIPDTTVTTISFDGASYDDLSMWDISDPTKAYVKRTGKYLIYAHALFGAGTGYKALAVGAGTGKDVIGTISDTSTVAVLTIANELNLYSGEVVTARVQQTSGGSLTMSYLKLTIRLVKAKDGEAGL